MAGKFVLALDEQRELIRQMTDDDAKCPVCGKRGFDSVTTMLSHRNQKHDGSIRQTETCNYCEEDFVPSNSTNDNKYCSETCFGLSDSGGRPHLGYVTYTCARDDCQQENTVRKSIRRLMGEKPACSNSCSIRGSSHPNWQGGSDSIRASPEYRQWKKTIHQSSDVCESCGASSNLQAHHIVPVSESREKATVVSNGRLLCGQCHSGKHPELSEELFY